MDYEPVVKSQRKLTVSRERKMHLYFNSNSLKFSLCARFYLVSSMCWFPVSVTGSFLPGEAGDTLQSPVWAIFEGQQGRPEPVTGFPEFVLSAVCEAVEWGWGCGAWILGPCLECSVFRGSRDPAPHHLEFTGSGSDLLVSFPSLPVMPLRRSQCAALALACIFFFFKVYLIYIAVLITAAKSLQSCPTLCDPIGGSPAGSPVPGILQARTLEWVAISFSSA